MNAHRIIDVNANRAREALRVMEDVARFALSDSMLCASLKAQRHELAEAIRALPGGQGALLAHRDTRGDVGTLIETKAEYQRTGLGAIASAASKRLSEALRTIEEMAKALAPNGAGAARAIEQIRYRCYDIERDLILALGTGRARQWTLCVLITESLCAFQDWIDVARKSVQGGADCVQLRELTLSDRELLDRARRLVGEIKSLNDHASIIINNRPDIALLAGADGVHVGQSDLSVRDVRRTAGDDLIIGVSTSCNEEARQAQRDGADDCGVGPMFPSTTKPTVRRAGIEYLREYVSHTPALPPHLAIGGITPDNVDEIAAAGAKGIAVSSCVCGAQRPEGVCEHLVEALTGIRTGRS